MAASGTNRAVMSDVIMKKGSESMLTKSLVNANEAAKALDPKNAKKAKK